MNKKNTRGMIVFGKKILQKSYFRIINMLS